MLFSWATKHIVSKSKRFNQSRSNKRRLLVEGLETRRVFAGYEVTTLQDYVDPNDGVLSLREAITQSNTTAELDTISFSPFLAPAGNATITLVGELVITQSVDIVGPTSKVLTIDANQQSRVFKIGDSNASNSQQITLSNLRLVNGKSSQGGAIYSTETLIVIGCTIQNSSADNGGAIYATNMLNIWESSLSRNQASASGGAIYAMSDLSVVDSTIALNSSAQKGGGIAIGDSQGYFVLINASVMANSSGEGGGVSAGTVFSSRIANSIIAGNQASSSGTSDTAGLLQWQATHNLIGVGQTGWTNAFQNNVVGIDWKTIVENDGTSPILKNNGGRSETIAILRNGPAANKGNKELFGDLAARTDQRGLPRLQSRQVDIGALELAPIESTTTVVASNRRYDGQAVKFTFEVKSTESTTVLPTGTVMVSFYTSKDNSALAHTSFVNIENGIGSLTFSEEGFGIYHLETKYFGDDNFLSSSAASLERAGKQVDYGDAPSSSQTGFASSYPVTFDENGARHTNVFSGVFLGRTISPANDGIHSANADADSSDDGVSWPFPLVSSSTDGISSVWIENGGSVVGKVDAWVDFNRDGDWNDAGEKIFDSANINPGRQFMSFSVPGGVSVGTTFARFRISLNGKLGPTGSAYDGEVEDSLVEIVSPDNASIRLSTEMSDILSRIDVVQGATILRSSAQGGILFKTTLNPMMEFVLTPTSSRTYTINDLQLENVGSISVRLEADRDVIKLRSATSNLLASLSSTATATNRLPEIDATDSTVQKITPNSSLYRVRIRHGAEDTLDTSYYRLSNPIIVNGEIMHRWVSGGVALEVVNPTPFQNPRNKYDVDFNGSLSAIDVLAIINALTRETPSGSMDLSKMDPANWRYTDVNGDGKTTPIDVLVLINELKRLAIPVPSYGSSRTGSGTLTLSGGVLDLTYGVGSVSVTSAANFNLRGSAVPINANVGSGSQGSINGNTSLVLTQTDLNQLPNNIVFESQGVVLGVLKKGSMEMAINAAYNGSLVRVAGRKIQIDSIVPALSSGVVSTFPLGDATINLRNQLTTERPTPTTLKLTPPPTPVNLTPTPISLSLTSTPITVNLTLTPTPLNLITIR